MAAITRVSRLTSAPLPGKGTEVFDTRSVTDIAGNVTRRGVTMRLQRSLLTQGRPVMRATAAANCASLHNLHQHRRHANISQPHHSQAVCPPLAGSMPYLWLAYFQQSCCGIKYGIKQICTPRLGPRALSTQNCVRACDLLRSSGCTTWILARLRQDCWYQLS